MLRPIKYIIQSSFSFFFFNVPSRKFKVTHIAYIYGS